MENFFVVSGDNLDSPVWPRAGYQIAGIRVRSDKRFRSKRPYCLISSMATTNEEPTTM
jgi:hypothetical protein